MTTKEQQEKHDRIIENAPFKALQRIESDIQKAIKDCNSAILNLEKYFKY